MSLSCWDGEDYFSPTFFSTVLQSHCHAPHLQVAHVHLTPLQEGLLSRVCLVQLTYAANNPSNLPASHWPTQLLLKTIADQSESESKSKHEMNTDNKNSMGRRMLATEGHFYRHYAPQLQASFQVPPLIQATSTWILLHYIPHATCFPLLLLSSNNGCPLPHHIIHDCLGHLAHLHARQWGVQWTTTTGLATPPGMGGQLEATLKVQQVHANSTSFLQRLEQQDVVPPSSSREMLQALLGWSSLANVHAQVYAPTWTLVHGDFHIGNWLFTPEKEKNGTGTAWLVDWGSCGVGNPLIDVVFFFLVSTTLEVSTLEAVVTQYYALLTDKHTSPQAERIRQTWSLTDCLALVRLVVVNQLMIFMAYDPLVRQLGVEAQDHFDRVHGRAVRTMLTPFMDYPRLFGCTPRFS